MPLPTKIRMKLEMGLAASAAVENAAGGGVGEAVRDAAALGVEVAAAALAGAGSAARTVEAPEAMEDVAGESVREPDARPAAFGAEAPARAAEAWPGEDCLPGDDVCELLREGPADGPFESFESAKADGIDAIAAPTPSAIARPPTRPTQRAQPDHEGWSCAASSVPPVVWSESRAITWGAPSRTCGVFPPA